MSQTGSLGAERLLSIQGCDIVLSSLAAAPWARGEREKEQQAQLFEDYLHIGA